MLKERARLIAVSVFTLDLALVTLAFLFAYWLRSSLLPGWLPGSFPQPLYPLSEYLPFLPLALAIWGALLLRTGRYRSHRTVPILEEAWAIIRVCATGIVIFALLLYALRIDEAVLDDDRISRLWIVLFAVLACLFLLTEKLAVRITSRWVRSRGYNYRTVLIVGTNPQARDMARSLDDHSFWGYRVLGFAVDGGSEEPPDLEELSHPIVGGVGDIPRIVSDQVVDEVIFCVGRRDIDRMEELFLALSEQGIQTRFALNFFPHTKAKVELGDMGEMPVLSFSTAPSSFLQLAVKRVLDLAISTLLLLLALPVVGLIALSIKLTSGGGTVLFRQIRCGLNGRSFTLYKFRTMVEDAEERRREVIHLNEMKGPVFKLRSDPRVTWLGRFLRKFSLDELPQLWNVLRGDMSLVGPRPPIPEEVAKYQRWQRRRLAMKPGLTCLWQISGRNEVDFDRWIELDLEYIDSWTPSLDLKILWKTIPVVLSGKGAS
ncbi:MAG TPA: sugar transferase [Thermoanaerobaculia bacterium]|nr:sugar transferase [Thermoanaerobaculia bacterium]